MTRQEAAVIARAARAKNIPPLEERFWSKVDMRNLAPMECWPWIAAVRRKDEGYGAFWLNGRHQPASKVAYMLVWGDVPNGMVVCHTCDNPRCCNPTHLFVGTPLENDKDRVEKGRQVRGSRQPNSVLTEELVLRLRKRAKEIGIAPAAREFGINEHTAWDACRRRWRHI